MKKKHTVAAMIAVVVSAVLIFGSCSGGRPGTEKTDGSGSETGGAQVSADIENMDFEFTERDGSTSYDEAAASFITLSDSGSSVNGAGASADGANVAVTAAGTYIVTGSV